MLNILSVHAILTIATSQDFGGRAVLIVRNPYAAILSDHNFIYAGHHGSAPLHNFERKGNVHTYRVELK